MKDGKNEFLGLLCNLYLVCLLVALPLYTGKGYWQLDETKYTLFRNLSLLCLGGWLLVGMPGRIGSAAEYLRMRRAGGKVQDTVAARTEPAGDEAVRQRQYRRENPEQKQHHGENPAQRQYRRENPEQKQHYGENPAQRQYHRENPERRNGKGARRNGAVFSSVDFAMMLYGACVILSAVCSDYGKLAWDGYGGWYMGAVSQLLFIGIYFFVSRQYDGAAWPVYLGETAFFLVTLLGLLHRLGIDPLGLMGDWNSRDWEYSHMLSTLGNINWLCGYYSVALAFVIVHFLQERRRWLQVVLYLVSGSAFVLLLVQGSQSGLLILGVCVAVCFFSGRGQRGVWGKMLLLLAGTFFFMPLMEMLMEMRGIKAAVVADGNIFAFISWYGWMLGAVICLFLFLLSEKKGEVFCGGKSAEKNGVQKAAHTDGKLTTEKAERRKHRRPAGLIVPVLLGIVTVLAGVLFWRRLDDSFGSGRGFLWRIAVESFMEADGKDKLLGAGPDCYGEAVFNRLGADTDVWKGEHWEGAVFTNAHNEILSQLCNVGILGTASYLAIFFTGMCRYGCGSRRRRGGDGYFGEAGCPGDGARPGNIAGESKGRESQEMRRSLREHREREKTGKTDRQGMERGLTGFCMGGIGLLALAMYGIHSLVSFQQVLNAPLLFLVLGLCEAERRQNG